MIIFERGFTDATIRFMRMVVAHLHPLQCPKKTDAIVEVAMNDTALKLNGYMWEIFMLICTFVGHTEVYAPIRDRLSHTIAESLKNIDEAIFYVGGRGEFDRMAASAVRATKRLYGDKDIRLYLVEPYMSEQLNRNKEYYEQFYDGIIIPDELIDVHPKAAITKRNRLMVDWSDLIIAYVYRNFGGAFQTLRYAQRMQKRIFNLAETPTAAIQSPQSPK